MIKKEAIMVKKEAVTVKKRRMYPRRGGSYCKEVKDVSM